MYEVIGHGQYNYHDTTTVDVGVVETITQARALIQQYSDYQFGQMVARGWTSMCEIEQYTIEQINVGATFLNGLRSRTLIETVNEPRMSWYQRGLFDVADLDVLPEETVDLLLPPTDGEWLQYQYDTSSSSGKQCAAAMYARTGIHRKIKDIGESFRRNWIKQRANSR